MPKPIKVVDAGDRGMISQATGKPVAPATSASQKPATNDNKNFIADAFEKAMESARQSVNAARRRTTRSVAKAPVVTSSTPPAGIANSSGTKQAAPTTTVGHEVRKMVGNIVTPSYGSDDETNSKYEDYFRKSGMSDDDINEINARGSWFDVHKDNPATAAVTDGFDRLAWENPFADMDINSLREDFDETVNSLKATGNFPRHEVPEQYKADTSSTIGDIYAVDDGKTMDYDHLTADKATGEAMQKYGELGMGGRSWWEYDPYALYTKSDEAQDYGFVPYLPDETARGNAKMNQILDAPGDLAGALGSARELIPAMTGTDYKIRYDQDGNKDTDDDIVFSGSDFDRRKDAFLHNMQRLGSIAPETFMTKPDDMMIHGAPVSVIVQEREIKDADGNTRYVHGDPVSASPNTTLHIGFNDGTSVDIDQDEWLSWWNGESLDIPDSVLGSNGGVDGSQVYTNDDSSMIRVGFQDGQTVNVTPETYDSWFDDNGNYALDDNGNTVLPRPSYVPIDMARGELPEDLDSMNEYYMRPENRQYWNSAPVLYMPDMVMSDGTRLNWEQFNDIYNDTDLGDNPDSATDDRVSYDYNMLNKPRRLMPDSGQVFSDDLSVNWGNIIPSSIDMTLGSLPISVDTVAWPLSVSQAISKSMAGINPGRYDPLTGTDQYVSADVVDGSIVPTGNDLGRISGVAGNALVPLTEQIAGPISGHSAIESLAGELPINPTLSQIGKAYLLGALGEGIEEIPGNVFDETTEFADSAYGDVVTPEGERLLDDEGNPVTNPDGSYKFVNPVTGRPYEYMTDQVGHIYKDPNTPMSRRLSNFLDWSDMLNAIAGGALVTTGMGLGSDAIHGVTGGRAGGSYLSQIPNAIKSKRYRQQQGLTQYVSPEEVAPEDRIRPTDEQLRMFER